MIDLEEERAFLAGVIVAPSRLPELDVRPEDLGGPEHRALWTWMQSTSIAWDEVSLPKELHDAGLADRCGGLTYLSGLSEFARAPVALDGIASRLVRLAERRKLSRAAEDLAQAAREEPHRLSAAREAFAKVQAASEARTAPAARVKPVSALLVEASKEWAATQARRAAGERIEIPSGIREIDQALGGGLYPKDLVLLAARPGLGKTSLGLQWADHAAYLGCRVLVISLEMTASQLILRRLGQTGHHPGLSQAVRSGQISPAELQALVARGAQQFEGLDLLIDDRPAQTVASIRATILTERPQLVIIDYIQLIAQRTDRYESRRLDVEHTSNVLKQTAKDADCSILALAHLSRSHEGQGRRPRMADLKEAGGLEQDADTILMLYRELGEPTLTELLIRKQRYGSTGTFPLAWDGPQTRYQDLPYQRRVEWEQHHQPGD